MGIRVKNLKEAIRFYRYFQFRVISRSRETWLCKPLKIVKMEDHKGNRIELIEGGWEPHVAITVNQTGAMDMIWRDLIQHVYDPVAYKEDKNLEVFFIRDPSGNLVEVVNQHE
jgi:catechol 2,3-dioxygenase-like lactoylglutathione lyase family enzyme